MSESRLKPMQSVETWQLSCLNVGAALWWDQPTPKLQVCFRLKFHFLLQKFINPFYGWTHTHKYLNLGNWVCKVIPSWTPQEVEKNRHYSTAAIWPPLDHKAALKWTIFQAAVKKINTFFLILNGAKFVILKSFCRMNLQSPKFSAFLFNMHSLK